MLKMNDMDILELALHNQQTAWNILEHTGIIPAWERIGATVHLVGSLKSGLLAKSRDIDLHIYTDTLNIAASFSVMQELAERLSLKEVQFKNLIQTEEECIEWHAIYEDEDMNTWKFDMIHIRKGSKYDGVVEKVTAAITNQLTPEIKKYHPSNKIRCAGRDTDSRHRNLSCCFRGWSSQLKNWNNGEKPIR